MLFFILTLVSTNTPLCGTHSLGAAGVLRRGKEAFLLSRADSLRYDFLTFFSLCNDSSRFLTMCVFVYAAKNPGRE